MRGGAKKGWRWRVADPEANRDLDLLYEPGNWGDILKGIWATVVARALAERSADELLRYVDPFAGAPTYPLTEPSRERLASVPVEWFVDLQRPQTTKGLLASTALLVRDAIFSGGKRAALSVFDTDAKRREAWMSLPDVQILAATSGESALEELERGESPPGLVLIDPYDFFVRWSFFLPMAISLAARSTVLAYSYNKSPRGPGQQRMYQDFRKGLQQSLGPRVGALLGRIPADAAVARAYHEVLLLARPHLLSDLKAELAAPTRALAASLAERGAFEEVG